MADQGRWFKLWCSAPTDADLLALSPALRWAWVGAGAYTKQHGSHGVLQSPDFNPGLALFMGVDADVVIVTLKQLPHVHIEEGKPVNGKFTVTWENWKKYQEDSTVTERMRRYRARQSVTSLEERRREEKRREKTPSVIPPMRTASSATLDPSPITPSFWAAIQGWLAETRSFSADNGLRDPRWWNAQIEAFPEVDFEVEVKKADAWLLSNPNRAKRYKNWPAFLHTWFRRAQEESQP